MIRTVGAPVDIAYVFIFIVYYYMFIYYFFVSQRDSLSSRVLDF